MRLGLRVTLVRAVLPGQVVKDEPELRQTAGDGQTDIAVGAAHRFPMGLPDPFEKVDNIVGRGRGPLIIRGAHHAKKVVGRGSLRTDEPSAARLAETLRQAGDLSQWRTLANEGACERQMRRS